MPKTTARDGHRLFVEMLDGFYEHFQRRADGVLDEELDTFWQHDNGALIHRYLAAVEEAGPEVSHGFYAALTDLLCWWSEGQFVPDQRWTDDGQGAQLRRLSTQTPLLRVVHGGRHG